MSNELTVEKLDEASDVLSAAEEDVLRGAWRRERRAGVEYVDAGVQSDGSLELVGTNGDALDKVSAAIRKAGTTVKRTQLPKPTRREFTSAYERAMLRGDKSFMRLLANVGEKYKPLRAAKKKRG